MIEQNRRAVEALQARGVLALYGDAANPLLLDRVSLAHARMLLVAIPDPMGTGQIVDYARRINPRIEIIVRTHSEEEWERLRAGQISGVVLGERELAITMAGYALRRFGVSSLEVQAILQGLRGQS